MGRLLVALMIFMTSCQLIIDVDVPYEGDKVVVNAVQRTDSVWAVELTQTRYILNETQHSYNPVDFATVTIHKPDGSTEKLVGKGEGLFKGTTYPETGQEYKVSVSAQGFDDVEGLMKMPPLVKIVDVVWDSAGMTNDGPGCNCTRANVPFTITFDDPAGEANYYDVSVYLHSSHTYSRYPDYVEVTDTMVLFQPTYVRDAGIASEDQSEFSDRAFDGKTRTIPMIAELRNTFGGTILKVEVRLTSSYDDYFKYNETLELQYKVMGDPFAQPAQVFSNMSNGFGIFTGTATDRMVWNAPPQD